METSGHDGFVHHLSCGDGPGGLNIRPNLPDCILYMQFTLRHGLNVCVPPHSQVEAHQPNVMSVFGGGAFGR